MGKLSVIAILAMVLVGCGNEDKDESTAKRVGDKVGETLTDFFSGVGKGFDEKRKVEVRLSEALIAVGLTRTTAKSTATSAPAKAITVYFLAKRPFKDASLRRHLAIVFNISTVI